MTLTTETEIAAAIGDAHAAGRTLRIEGGGTRGCLGSAVVADDKLSVAGNAGITLYEPGALTLVAKAGTPMADVKAALDAEGQMLAFEPLDHAALTGAKGAATIGGAVASNASGPRRIQAGACRDALIGVRFVDGTGEIIKNGGRVMKNVTGYDLVKLMAGSFGSLGVLTEVSFKTLPKPEATRTLTVSGLDAAQAQRLMSDVLKTPFDVTGAAFDATKSEGHIRLEGFDKSVTYRARELASLCQSYGKTKTSKEGKIWDRLSGFGFAPKTSHALWQASVKPTDGPKLIKAIESKSDARALVMDWAGGLVSFEAPADLDLHDLFVGTEIKGHMICLSGDHDYARTADPMIAKIEAGLRAKFDPKGILNPGIMG